MRIADRILGMNSIDQYLHNRLVFVFLSSNYGKHTTQSLRSKKSKNTDSPFYLAGVFPHLPYLVQSCAHGSGDQ